MSSENTEIKNVKIDSVQILTSLVAIILFFITCFAAYNGYSSFTQGHSINEQIYSVIIILISIFSFIGFIIIMQIDHLITLVKEAISKK